MKRYLLVYILIIILSGCTAKSTSITLKETQNPTIEDVKFSISSFDLKYEKDKTHSEETYTGSGIISALGNGDIAKKPYLVLIKETKISGGGKDGSSERLENVIVENGIGKFSTWDYSFDKEVPLEKPIYEFKIIGYLPYNEITSK